MIGAPETAIFTPDGRIIYPDISTIDPQGKHYYENVGLTTKAGKPIARERRALEDIHRATGRRPGFTGY